MRSGPPPKGQPASKQKHSTPRGPLAQAIARRLSLLLATRPSRHLMTWMEPNIELPTLLQEMTDGAPCPVVPGLEDLVIWKPNHLLA